MKHERFFRIAKRLAGKTDRMKRQVAALIVDGNTIVARGRNRISHPQVPQIVSATTGKRYYGLHAEIHALLQCAFPVAGMTVYVHGQNSRTGNTVYSKPCELCEHFLRKRGIKEAIFATPSGYECVKYSV